VRGCTVVCGRISAVDLENAGGDHVVMRRWYRMVAPLVLPQPGTPDLTTPETERELGHGQRGTGDREVT
jgi:hypothetical protein